LAPAPRRPSCLAGEGGLERVEAIPAEGVHPHRRTATVARRGGEVAPEVRPECSTADATSLVPRRARRASALAPGAGPRARTGGRTARAGAHQPCGDDLAARSSSSAPACPGVQPPRVGPPGVEGGQRVARSGQQGVADASSSPGAGVAGVETRRR
jgi:hypothetical protein